MKYIHISILHFFGLVSRFEEEGEEIWFVYSLLFFLSDSDLSLLLRMLHVDSPRRVSR